ncbi:helix-turn-helix domain-containing protein [Staphylococcus equorum]|uniref:helix-turn-helix domain-containing protein n=1 Tax=Staphylococcus equorum TaxID=246432 RepID=UPI002175107D|nr:helix-turn-helix domain-containing protein [Staphylococcus equorum]
MRKEHQLTQEQLSEQLNVSRQTVSAWENNRYLPDIEIIVHIAKTFHLSLDDLILGDDVIKDKLVNDGKSIKRIRLSIVSMILIGITCAILFLAIPSYVSQDGILHEPWFLVPLGLYALIGGLTVGLINLILIFMSHYKHSRS